MSGSQANIILAVLVVVVLLIVAYQQKWFSMPGKAEGFCGVATPYGEPKYNPYTILNKDIDAIRGYKNDGFNQPPIWRQPHGLDRYHQSGASVTPDMIAEAERDEWYAATPADNAGQMNTDLIQDPGSSSDPQREGFHCANNNLDYGAYVTDLIVDPRTKDNHRRWVEEMQPWSGTAMTVDDLEEAQEADLDFIGLRRPQPVAQYNPMQLTEVTTMNLIGNKKFNFQG
jgi:hypothetical protein